jgi:hypothetical protein
MTIRTYDLAGVDEPERARPRCAVWYLLNPTDDPTVLAALDTPEIRARRRMLLVRLAPTSRSRVELAYDTLRALQISRDELRPHGIAPDDLPRLLTHRLCGMRLSVLAIDCPHPLAPAQLTLARTWCDHLQAQLVLVARAPTVRPYLTTSLDALLRAASPPAPTTPRWSDQLAALELPTDEFTTFRATCRRLLPAEFATIDELYTRVYDDTRARLAAPGRTAQANATMAVFHALSVDDPPATVRLIALRAIQAAVFTHAGLLLSWRPWRGRTLEGALPGSLTPRCHLVKLHPVLDPAAAIANLAWGYLEVTEDALQALPGHALIADDRGAERTAPALKINTHLLRLPTWSLPIVRAYHCQRNHFRPPEASEPKQLLLRDNTPMTAREISSAMHCTHYATDGYRNQTFPDGELAAPEIPSWDYRTLRYSARFPNRWLSNRGLFIYRLPISFPPTTTASSEPPDPPAPP